MIFNIENQLLEYDFGTFCTQLKLSEKTSEKSSENLHQIGPQSN